MNPNIPSQPKPAPQVREADVIAELDWILASREFAAAERLSRFLRFVVEGTLRGDRDRLKESVIGIEVFDRNPGYDPKVEPVVRTAAMRLRAKLDEYYAVPGRPYRVRISIPKGGYFAEFEPRPQPVAVSAPDSYYVPPLRARLRLWPFAAGIAAVAAIAYFTVRSLPPRTTCSLHRNELSRPPAATCALPGRQPNGFRLGWGIRDEPGHIYITMAAGGAPRRITSDPGADDFPAWSPDGSLLAFVHENCSLMLITPLGTNQRPLTSAYNSKLSWTSDGRHIAFSDWLPNHGPLAVFLVDVASGARRPVSAPGDAWPGDVLAEVSSDGREIALVRSTRTSSAIYRLPIGGGEPRLVIPARAWSSLRHYLVPERSPHCLFGAHGSGLHAMVRAG